MSPPSAIPRLLELAGMTQHEFDSRVVLNTDRAIGDMRIKISDGLMAWGDTVAIETYLGDHTWQRAHFSTARARIIAHLIMVQVHKIERNNGGETRRIDPPAKPPRGQN